MGRRGGGSGGGLSCVGENKVVVACSPITSSSRVIHGLTLSKGELKFKSVDESLSWTR